MTSKCTLALLFLLALGLWSCGESDSAGGKGPTEADTSGTPDLDLANPDSPDRDKAEVNEPGKIGDPAPVATQPAPTVQEVPELPPLKFEPALPTTPIATVNGTSVPASGLLEFVLTQNFSAGVNSLVLAKIVDREVVKQEIEVTAEALNDEIRISIGGCAATTAAALTRLGVHTVARASAE